MSQNSFSQTGTFDYDKAPGRRQLLKAPSGVAKRLPRVPKYQLAPSNKQVTGTQLWQIPNYVFSPLYWQQPTFKHPIFPEVN